MLWYSPHMSSLLLQGGTVVTDRGMAAQDLFVQDGRVLEGDGTDATERIDAQGKLLLPGLIDCHVHFRDPGLTHKATMASEAFAARAGGVLTVCEMPNTVPPTVTVAALADKVRRAALINDCDIRFFFGMTEAIHLATFRELMESSAEESQRLRSRVCGVKLYLDHSTGNQKAADEVIADVFAACAQLDVVLVAHCEDPATNAAAALQLQRTDIAAHSLRRPAQAEVIAVENAIALARTHGTKLHVAHLSTEGALDAVKKAKEEGLPVTCEVTPHHLFLTTDDYETLGTRGKMNPPLRSTEHRDALWRGIEHGIVDCISTDHAPHTLEEKEITPPLDAPSGVPGVETMVPLLLSVAGGRWPHPSSHSPVLRFTYQDIVRLCFTHPNDIFSLGKEPLVPGACPSVLMIDPAKQWTIRGQELHSACKWTPFEGWTVKGWVEKVVQF